MPDLKLRHSIPTNHDTLVELVPGPEVHILISQQVLLAIQLQARISGNVPPLDWPNAKCRGNADIRVVLVDRT
ncbi:hypothetical protein BDR04DRAFT_1235686 [Suillus decipiens]|nr:hypothetical protein BDR04DRAFT_1235686 [Suillus decipiens]